MRLELNQGWYRCRSYIFQFHKGAIRTISTPWVLPECRNFNSIKVRLEQSALLTPILRLSHFNSIKVRLEPCESTLQLQAENWFQFHKGAIRTSFSLCTEIKVVNFNSIKVRLELQMPWNLLANLCHFNSIKVRLEQNQIQLLLLPILISIP